MTARTIFWYLKFPFKWLAHTERRKGYAREAKHVAQKLVIAEAIGDAKIIDLLRARIKKLKEYDMDEMRNIARFHGVDEEQS